jgi:hypothetical protein
MSTSDITTKLYIATGVPATFDKAGYEALTWVQVKGIVSVGSIGVTDSIIDVPDLETGFTKSVKGARVGTVIPVAMREIKSDAGQAALKTACEAFTEYSFKVLEPTAADEVEYISGLPHDWLRNERSTTAYAGFTANIRSNYPSVVVATPS